MSKFDYLVSDGGPHVVLPAEFSATWKAAASGEDATNPTTDYGRACAATTSSQFAMIPVAGGRAIALQDPPMTAWGIPQSGIVDIYYLRDWDSMNLDALINRAVAALPLSLMADTGETIELTKPNLFLMFAGDSTTRSAYGVLTIACDPGRYNVYSGRHHESPRGDVTIYRLVLDEVSKE